MTADPIDWMTLCPQGLYCIPGDFYIDPVRKVSRAVITHGHSDHARAGNEAVMATRETLAVMRCRLGERCYGQEQALEYGEVARLGDVQVRLAPAGHVLGSAQVVLEHKGKRLVVSGDFKRRPDPTCPPFEVVPCDVFVTEATFGLPVFRHPNDQGEIAKLLHSLSVFPDRPHLIGAYTLGKAQRIVALLRIAGYERPIYLHPAAEPLFQVYEAMGVSLGEMRCGSDADLNGEIALCPPNALDGAWSKRCEAPITAQASGWLGIRKRARQSGVDLPLVLSDHADWPELVDTLRDVDAPRVWVTHGREDALIHQAQCMGIEAEALSQVSFRERGAG